jgi:hypothetical protein
MPAMPPRWIKERRDIPARLVSALTAEFIEIQSIVS